MDTATARNRARRGVKRKRETMHCVKKSATAIFHTHFPHWKPEAVDLSKITRLDVVSVGKLVIGRVVIKELSDVDYNHSSISSILGIPIFGFYQPKWKNEEVEGWVEGWVEFFLTVKDRLVNGYDSRLTLKYMYANIWDPWMMDSFKTTSSVLSKRSIPADLINMIQEFTHVTGHNRLTR